MPVVRSRLVVILGGALCLATAALLALGYRATIEWQRSEVQLADRRASEKLALLIAALDRDMKGAQLSVLVPVNEEQLAGRGAAGLSSLFARAFARFPYPETFFVWSEREPEQELTYVFNRADRRPPWDKTADAAVRYPVVTHRGPTPLDPFIARIRKDATHRKRFAASEAVIEGVPYQVVVHLLYDDVTGAGRLFGMVGYTVNLPWARKEYFNELVGQVARIGGEGDDMALTITDHRGEIVASTASSPDPGPAPHARKFPIMFFDDNLTEVGQAAKSSEHWTALVTPVPGQAEPAALSGQRMFALMGLAALGSLISVGVIARAIVVKSQLIAMKSEFVSTVTHELKTPLALMRLVADTLVTGRYTGPEKVREYGEMLSAEVARMTHMIDNLLSFARLSRVENLYHRTRIDLAELLEEALALSQARLDELHFTVKVETGIEAVHVHADRAAMLMVLANLLDNAIKYTPEGAPMSITLRGRKVESGVLIEVEDSGSGIHQEDLPHVLEKFFRGRHARTGGSGLGLSIVQQIVRDHGGRVDIRSAMGAGTTVRVFLPAA